MRKRTTLNSDRFFYILWTVYSVYAILLGQSEIYYDYDIGTLFNVLSFIVAAVMIAGLFRLRHMKQRKVIFFVVFLVIVFITELRIGDLNLLILALFVIHGQDIQMDKMLRYDLLLKTLLLIVIFALCALGITENYSSSLFVTGTKMALGFRHPNTLTCYVLCMLAEWLCIRFKRMKWYEWVLIFAIWAVVMEIAGGRSSGYAFIFIYFVFLLATLKTKAFYTNFIQFLFRISAPLLAGISFLGVWLYSRGNSLIVLIDNVLASRFYYGLKGLTDYGIRFFGQVVSFTGTRNSGKNNLTVFVIDNSYIHYSITWGGILLFLLLILYVILFVNLFRYKRLDLALFALFFVVLGFGETYMFNLIYNISLLGILGVSARMAQPIGVGELNRRRGRVHIHVTFGKHR
ncbi:MAG: hypothetical protein LUF32_04345 [Clostridiales bacterium]|nr:hypothetical protein [Clostridiales bacterium]